MISSGLKMSNATTSTIRIKGIDSQDWLHLIGIPEQYISITG
jgi:hypothetical protein